MSSSLIRVAIVDDDASVRKALALLLNASSFVAETHESGAEFLRSLAKGKPHCLVVDLQMPEMTGLELQHRLVSEGVRIPTIAITAHNEFDVQRKCEAAGAKAFLLKPIQEAVLLDAIKSALK